MCALLAAMILAALLVWSPFFRQACLAAALLFAMLVALVSAARAADDRESVAFTLAVVYVYENRCQKVLTQEEDERLVMLYRWVGAQVVENMLEHVERAFVRTGKAEWCEIARADVVNPLLEPIP
jgi:hypothetical protein